MSILIYLQANRWVKVQLLSAKFEVSSRTIYRDIHTLSQAGIPIVAKEGKGFSVMDHYRIPAMMFTENEANALITAQKLIAGNGDASLVREYSVAVAKVRAVLDGNLRDKINLLSDRTAVRKNHSTDKTSNYLIDIQKALTGHFTVEISYCDEHLQLSHRKIEPFALYHSDDNWLLIGFCLLRGDYRSFRLDRIKKLEVMKENFPAHPISLAGYFEMIKKKSTAVT
ncbi:YafY family protein [uncultured Pedobacter sp.]|uniref:helix-turn-helix transcriptional regulator n=1 Tax=uncultured Pedobacter sp. TaxID=246139 RepID=UPI00261509BC|nr:YafY family protein [uncultured Pedobacter sp.]